MRVTESSGTTRGLGRLVTVTHYFPGHRGGIELVASALVPRLAEECNMVVDWFASDCDALPTAPRVTPRPMPAWNGMEIRTGLPYPLWSPGHWLSLWRAIRHCNLVHIHDYIYMGSLLAWGMAKLAGRPCVITQHVGNVPVTNRALRLLLTVANATIGRLILGRSTATVFVSDNIRRQFFRANLKHVKVIANGVDTSIFRPLHAGDRAKLRARIGLKEDQPVLLFVGRFVAKKGLPLLQELVPRLPRVQWVFAGQGPLDPETWKIPSVRVFRDRASTTLAELYQAADLLVLPSVGEGFPLVVQEAMACGTPALSGSELLGALPGIDNALYTEDVLGPKSAARWQTRLQGLLATPQELLQRRQVVAEFAREHWSWNRCADEYSALYREVASQ